MVNTRFTSIYVPKCFLQFKIILKRLGIKDSVVSVHWLPRSYEIFPSVTSMSMKAFKQIVVNVTHS